MTKELDVAPLGKKSTYIDTYTPSLLFPILRQNKRDELSLLEGALPFVGCDRWTAYEISWLTLTGKPEVAVIEFIFDCRSPCIIESKSFKLYLNSFNNSKFSSFDEVLSLLTNDLTQACQFPCEVKRLFEQDQRPAVIQPLTGTCLDTLDVTCTDYVVNSRLLGFDGQDNVSEVVFSHLLKSNCLVTEQPDWGSIWIEYTGRRLCHASILKYIISFRNHNEFHEQCVERIFMDLMREGSPEQLSVYACYTRRGGLDINPFRSTHLIHPPMRYRLFRQ